MKMRKTVVAGVLTGAALLSGGVLATVASADVADVPSPDGVNIGNNACIAPWMWNGPGVVGVSGQTSTYEACTGGAEAVAGDGFTAFNNACILPWNWNGPFNGLMTGNTSTYSSCK